MQVTSNTAKKLLTTVTEKGGCNIETAGGRGSHGGKTVSYGSRDRDAMFALIDAGLVKLVSHQTWSETNRGYTQRGSIYRIEKA